MRPSSVLIVSDIGKVCALSVLAVNPASLSTKTVEELVCTGAWTRYTTG